MIELLKLKIVSTTAMIASLALGTNFAFSSTAQAQNAIRSGFNSNILDRNDDGSAPFFGLPFGINFFGANYNGLYVNNNGNVTFNGPLSTFTPFGLANVNTPIIAPFFADVDTRNDASSVVTYGNGTVEGRTAFAANWDSQGVGYYPSAADKLNKFQLVIIDRSDIGVGDFDFEFNYEQIQWETGSASGGVNGLGGTSAGVGYSNGLTGSADVSLEFIGSRVPNTFLDTGVDPLINSSLNSGVDGRYRFVVRNGAQIPPGTTPSEPVLPEPPTPGNPAFNFANIPIGTNGFGTTPALPIFFDPIIAVGYDYAITDGPNFGSVIIPDALPNGDSEFTLNLPGVGSFDLLAGTSFDLTTYSATGFSNFSITGIDTSEALDPTNPFAFVTGLSFVVPGPIGTLSNVSLTQTPITLNTGGSTGVPEPSSLLGLGLLGLGLSLTRKKSH